ncbi:MAG: polyprenol monophosphomannose synthase [Candidatus Kerfeldbacteria bacterium]|nr:polyprenol monophosphomannose synthase [Candidatus Kerfeldbacteria bacterium]
MARHCIILPTYNEKENITGIVREILALAIPELCVLVVDDNSPDGTGQIADELARHDQRISVLHRDAKEGLGKAYTAGFRWALRDPQIEHVFEMDADFSHQPKYIPNFLEAIQSADLVLGSRYIPGGGVANWNWSRRMISTTANMIIRRLLGMAVHDLTGGFKCFRRTVLERLDLDAVASRGYNFQIEVTYRAGQAGFRIQEIPITFIERRAGTSKFSPGIMLESFWQVLRLRFGGK